MRLQFSTIWYVILITILSISGCNDSRSTDKLLAKLKHDREIVGLRPVGLDWTLERVTTKYIRWSYAHAFMKNGELAKVTEYRLDEPVWEEDYYYSGRSFPAADGDGATMKEQLTIHFDYKANLCAVRLISDDKSLMNLVHGQLEQTGLAISDAMPVAQVIMRKWGLGG